MMNESPKNEDQKIKEIIIQSGRICTISGEFEIKDRISTTAYVSKGELMPLYCGRKVKWTLVRKG
ncbi:hypothetical protein ACR1PO_02820 [Chryseobacterium sp. RRHN12]|uniref:hypothetical protein n=1 Tax=Chryseobacterium sp. RRHN12 TaxID=3437884 RepID=UPI003D9AD8AD